MCFITSRIGKRQILNPMCSMLLLLASLGAMPVQADIFVSPGGADDLPGTEERPFATLERAREAVRAMKRQGTVPERGLTVWLRAGDLFEFNDIHHVALDSGDVGAIYTGRHFTYRGNRIRYNYIYWFALRQHQEVRDNFVTEDSAHIGGPETGFKLPKDSPAWGMGFEPIPFDKIGLYPDEDRKRLERVWGKQNNISTKPAHHEQEAGDDYQQRVSSTGSPTRLSSWAGPRIVFSLASSSPETMQEAAYWSARPPRTAFTRSSVCAAKTSLTTGISRSRKGPAPWTL